MIKQTIRDAIRRYWYEMPRESFRKRLEEENSHISQFAVHTARLLTDGVVILPEYFQGGKLDAIRQEFEIIAASLPDLAKGQISIEREFLKASEIFSLAAIDPYILSVVAHYWGKPIYLTEWTARRIYPHKSENYGAFQYHHDTKNKQVKAMLLLTDVADDGQRMDYIRGTHGHRRSWGDYSETRFTDEDALSLGEVLKCAGPAGTVVIFDTNGLHRGNRNLSSTRDTITANFTAGHARFLDNGLHAHAVELLSAKHREIFRLSAPVGDFLLRRL